MYITCDRAGANCHRLPQGYMIGENGVATLCDMHFDELIIDMVGLKLQDKYKLLYFSDDQARGLRGRLHDLGDNASLEFTDDEIDAGMRAANQRIAAIKHTQGAKIATVKKDFRNDQIKAHAKDVGVTAAKSLGVNILMYGGIIAVLLIIGAIVSSK